MNLLKKIGIKSERTKNISKQVLLSTFYKGGSILSSFLLVPLTINYLDTTNYGIWLIITSFVAWFNFFDIGLGLGMRNKFAEAKANNNMQLAKAYISSAYFSIGLISVVLFLFFIIINNFIDWYNVFNVERNTVFKLSNIMMIVFSSFFIRMVLKLITTLYSADLRPSISGLIGFVTQASSLLIIFILTKFYTSSLFVFSIIFSLLPIVILLAFSLYSFNNKYKKLKPSYKLFKIKYVKDIMGLGINFFIIQIAWLIVNSTDNIIITQLFDPSQVTIYNIAFKYFNITLMIFLIILTPYWSAITDAYAKNDFDWIKKSIQSLQKISVVFIIFSIVMIFTANIFYKIWVGDKIQIPLLLNVFMSVFIIIRLIIQPFIFFINGVGKIKLQLYSTVIGAIINIPLSIFFVKYFHLGLSGVIIATICSYTIGLILYPIQYFKIINNNAKGIWNK